MNADRERERARPRVVIAGLSGDSGKTMVALGMLLAARARGLEVAAFKKGPDYIDAAWLSWASGRPARNLDSFLAGFPGCLTSFGRHAVREGLNVIEGNRGLYDGVDAAGTHSTAELAKALHAPVILVLNAAKVTRTIMAPILGCLDLDPDVHIAGVVLNRVAGRRHETMLRAAVDACGLPVLGVVPKAAATTLLPDRHLGLVTPAEHPAIAELERNLRTLVADRLELELVAAVAREAPPLTAPPPRAAQPAPSSNVRIGFLRDSAFTFYYPENLEALEELGAELIPLSSLDTPELPGDLAGLYIGGGFPETHGAAISRNRSFLDSLCRRAASGLPIYAECGGLMLLSQAVVWRGSTYPMAGWLPFSVHVCDTPQGHGYAELLVDRPNPIYPVGLALKGHEFHYSRIDPRTEELPTACAVRRGTGCYRGREGIFRANTWACYTHIHALGTPEWAPALVQCARRFASAAASKTVIGE